MTNMRVGHASMQFSDNKSQKEHDAKALFDRAVKKDYLWLSGTEAGEQPLISILAQQATAHGYSFHHFKSLWIAVHKDSIVPGTFSHDSDTIVPNELTVGHGHDTSLLWVTFDHEEFGTITEMVSHYPRFGRPGAHDPEYRVNLKWTEKTAHAIGDAASDLGRGKKLFFYSGDQNIPDSISDTFFGEPMTSAGDELDKHPNTGHGPIDVIASYDRDGRVKAVSFRSFNDKQFFLNTDHFLIEAVFDVTPVKKKS